MTQTARTQAHLVLGAGGVRCIAYIGALLQLEAEGYEFASVSTCSAATFVGALYCCGVPPEKMQSAVLSLDLHRLAGDVKWRRLRRLWSLRSWPYALYEEPGLPKVFRRILADQGFEPDPQLGGLRIPLATAAVDVAANRFLVYTSETNPSLHVAELLQIATAIPLMYAPHTAHGREVLDAALASHTPIWLASGQPEELPIVALRVPPARAFDRRQAFVPWLNEVLSSAVVSRDTFDLERVPGVAVIDVETQVASDDFGLSPPQLRELMERGGTAVAEWGRRAAEGRLQRIVPPRAPKDDDDHAQREGARRYQLHLDRLARGRTPTVFLSYAHEDREWLNRLRARLRPLLKDPTVTVWDDSLIAPGADWDAAIHDAILRARVAVLFVSKHFTSSNYAVATELAALRDQRRRGRVRIFWLSLDGTRPDEPELELQGLNDPEQPLDSMVPAAADGILGELARRVEEFTRSLETTR